MPRQRAVLAAYLETGSYQAAARLGTTREAVAQELRLRGRLGCANTAQAVYLLAAELEVPTGR